MILESRFPIPLSHFGQVVSLAVNIYFDVAFQDLIVFIGLGRFILWREASSFVLNFELQKRHFDGIRLLSIFL